jgi:hypothetical protein
MTRCGTHIGVGCQEAVERGWAMVEKVPVDEEWTEEDTEALTVRWSVACRDWRVVRS